MVVDTERTTIDMLHLEHLDETTRQFMSSEVESDRTSGRLYGSPRLTPQGRVEFPDLLLNAARTGSPATLELAISARLNAGIPVAATAKRAAYVRTMDEDAAEALADGEFNHYYMRGVCIRAIAEGIEFVEGCRAKDVSEERPESRAMIGHLFDPTWLLAQLRSRTNGRVPKGIPGQPKSGVSIRLTTTTPSAQDSE